MNNQNIETIPFGNFIIEKPSDEEVKMLTTHTGYDYMIKFRVPYRHSLGNVFTAGSLFDDLCRQAGVGAGSTSFVNSDYIIVGNAYTNNETCEDVLKDLAKLAVGFAKIGRDNKCYIKTPTIDLPVESIDGNDYTDTFTTNGQFGEVNALYVGLSQVDGETTKRKDDESIAQNGEKSIKINDIAFLINETEREKVIDNMWAAIKGLTYLAGEYTYKGFPYLDVGDEIQLYDNEDNPFTSYAFNIDFTYNGTYSGKIQTPIITNVTATYSPANTIKNTFKKVELSVDKINGMMQSTVEQVNKQNNKISQVTQTLDDLNSKISDIANITIAGESNYAQVELDNINQSEPIMLRVHPVLENISYLYPHTNLFPSALTYLKTRKIRFTRTYDEEGETKTEFIDYTLPDDLLWYDNETYDEFYLNYESQTCQVIKRCAYNADGIVRKLTEEVVTDYEYPTILLGDGDYQIKVMGYDTAYLSVRLMAQNMYTTQFATKAEMTSAIEQKADSIMLEVNEKVNEDEIIAQLNVAIQEGRGIVRLVGNQVIIDSDNFKLLSDGSMQANNGTFNGDVVIDASNTLKVKKDANKNLMEIGSNGQSFYNDDGSVAGAIGTTYANTSTYGTLKGLQFCLDREGFFMGWFSKYRADNDFTHKLMYAKAMSGIFPENDQNIEGLFAGCHLFMKGYRLFTNGSGGINIVQNMLQTGDDNLDFFVQTNLRVTKDLYVYGHIYGTIASDRRLKQNIKDSEINAIELIKQIKHRQFEWKEDGRHEENGYIAQEMEEIHENFVEKVPIATPDGKVTDYKYCISESFTLATATKAIQEQQQEIEQLKNEIKELKEMMRKGI